MEEQLIYSEPSIMMGTPVVKGTCIPVELIVEKLAVGETFEQVLDVHPRLTRASIPRSFAPTFGAGKKNQFSSIPSLTGHSS